MGTILLALLGTVLQLWLTATWENPNLDLNPMRTATVFVLGCGALLLGYLLDDVRLARHGRIVYVGALVAGVVAVALSPAPAETVPEVILPSTSLQARELLVSPLR